MLRTKGLTDKLIVLGIDGMDPRFSKAMVEEGNMPNLKKLIELGAAREDLMLLGAMPTITPPMWATLATGAYPMTHGIIDYNIRVAGDLDITMEAFLSPFCKAEQIWNVTAESGKKTLVFHWPGGAWPPSTDSENLYVVDGTSPGALGHNAMSVDGETMVIATTKTERGGFVPYAAFNSHVDGNLDDILAMMPSMDMTPDPRIQQHYEDFLSRDTVFQGYKPPRYLTIKNMVFYGGDSTMARLADFSINLSMSPVAEAEGWANAPEGAKEFTIYYMYGKVQKPVLILKNAEGKYDRLAIYETKADAEPAIILENDVFTRDCKVMMPTKSGIVETVRDMRALEIAEDGSYVRLWVGEAMNCEDNRVWYPQWIFDSIKENVGMPCGSSMAAGQDEDLIMKCSQEQWKHCAEWQSAAMRYMIDQQGIEVIFSHFHGPDLAGHSYMKYLKDRDTSIVGENKVREWHVNTYKWTDDYIGSFLPYIDKGWTILLVSDHALICPEHDHQDIGDNSGINVGVMKELGYTVLKKDENGNELKEIDWSKTRAVQTRANSIYVNLKGRDNHGIVDPADKYELEEQIITDLYGYKDKKTGKRIVALALHNKDAVLLGMGGEYAADIIFMLHESFNFDHGESMSTACGHNDTSVSPIFVAAGPGVKPGYEIKGYVREVDVAPTAAVLLGVDIPAQCEGAPAYQIFTESM